MKISLKYKNKKISLEVKKVSSFGKITGLMFKTVNTPILLFDFKKNTRVAIHSFFVFFPFIAVWIDDKNKIVDSRIVKPFSFSINSRKPFKKLIEIPLNNKNKGLVSKLL